MTNLQDYLNNSKSYFRLSDEQRLAFLNGLHYEHNYSMNEIAGVLGTYLNRVLRDATSLGFKKRSKSETQKLLLAEGKREHPTKGKQRSEDTKLKISEGVGTMWDNMNDTDRKSRQDKSREHWESIDPNKKKDIKNKAMAGIRKSSKEGSKLEKFIYDSLTKAGFVIIYHKEHSLLNEKMHLDMVLPNYGIVIEIDGPSHQEPIWGEETFSRNQRADKNKTALCLSMGYWMLRVKQNKRLSQRYMRQLSTKVLETITSIKDGKIVKKPENMSITIEV